MSELKPCPFCGTKDTVIVLENNSEDGRYVTVICNWLKGGCGADGGQRLTKKDAVDAWNKRVDK